MSGKVAKLKKEIREVLVAAAFFSTGFCLIHMANRLFTEGSNVELASLTRAAIGGLIVAKVLLTVNLLPLVNAFADRPLAASIVWKTAIYLSGGVIFLYAEPFLKNLIQEKGLSASHFSAWHELMLPRTWGTVILTGMLLAVFVTFEQISQEMGEGQLKDMLIGSRKKSAAGPRKAA